MAHRNIKSWLAVGATAALALVAVPSTASASTESLSVNLASTQGAMTGVGEGFLYGLSQDGSSPGDNCSRSTPLSCAAAVRASRVTGGSATATSRVPATKRA